MWGRRGGEWEDKGKVVGKQKDALQVHACIALAFPFT